MLPETLPVKDSIIDSVSPRMLEITSMEPEAVALPSLERKAMTRPSTSPTILMATVMAEVALPLAENVPLRLVRVEVISPAMPETVVPFVIMLVARLAARDSISLITSPRIFSALK